MWYIVALAACVAGDQLLKWWVVSHLEVGQSAPLLPGVVQLTRLHNTGAAWSSFSGKTGLLAGNYDITHIYIDPVFKMCGRDFEAFTQMVNKLDSLRATQDVQIIFTLSCEPEDLPYHLRDMMIENW